jgi:hypothetical protein
VAGFIRPTPKPAARELGGESFFGVHSLRLFNGQVGRHLIDPSRHPVSQRPFDGEIRRMPRLARGKFGRLLFGALLGRRKLRLERIDVGFERSDDLIGKRSFIGIPEALSVAVNPSDIVPTLGRANSRSLIVSERLLPSATLGTLPNRLGRDAQQVRRLPVRKPLARQIAPVGKTSDDPAPPCRSAARVLPHLGRGAQDEATG